MLGKGEFSRWAIFSPPRGCPSIRTGGEGSRQASGHSTYFSCLSTGGPQSQPGCGFMRQTLLLQTRSFSGKSLGLEAKDRVPVPALPPTCCVTSGKSLQLSGIHFSYLPYLSHRAIVRINKRRCMENILKPGSTVQTERVGSYPQDTVAHPHTPSTRSPHSPDGSRTECMCPSPTWALAMSLPT